MFVISGIYKIENVVNHKVYIGQSIDVYRRFKEHFQSSSKLSNTYLHYAIFHYGIENFTFQILKETYDLDYWEKFFITIYHSYDAKYGYNLTTGGQKNSKRTDNFYFTNKIKQKMSEAKKKNWQDEEYRLQMINAQNVGKHTEEYSRTRSEATKNMWLTGKFKNQAKKISSTMKGRKLSEETKQRMKVASKLREEKHKQDYELYVLNGGFLNYNEFCKSYNKGVNKLLEELLCN